MRDAVGAFTFRESLLLLHEQTLARDSSWRVSRLDQDGVVVWDADTGLADPTRLLVTGSALVIGGYRDFHEPTRMRPYHLAFFDLDTGTVETPAVADL